MSEKLWCDNCGSEYAIAPRDGCRCGSGMLLRWPPVPTDKTPDQTQKEIERDDLTQVLCNQEAIMEALHKLLGLVAGHQIERDWLMQRLRETRNILKSKLPTEAPHD